MNHQRNILAILLIALLGFSNQGIAQETHTKYPLLELFTNTRCSICGAQDPGFVNRLSGYEGEYHMVSFYPGRPYSNCFFYQQNIDENTVRKDFYPSFFGTPDVGINGIDFRSPNGVTTDLLDDITGGTSWLAVQVAETDGSSRDVTITLEYEGGSNIEAGVLFAVIVEREVMYDAPNGINVHHNVFRKFLTNENGEALDLNGDIASKSYQYSVNSDWEEDEVYVVAWLMDSESQEIFNSGTKFDEVSSSTSNVLEQLTLELYPNPVSDIINIEVPSGSGGILTVYDPNGRQVHQASVLSGDVRISVSEWAVGTYAVEVEMEDRVLRGKVVVLR